MSSAGIMHSGTNPFHRFNTFHLVAYCSIYDHIQISSILNCCLYLSAACSLIDIAMPAPCKNVYLLINLLVYNQFSTGKYIWY